MAKQEPGKVRIKISKEKQKKILNLLVNFYNKHKLYSGESLQQDDNGSLNSPVVMGDIADILFENVEIDY